MATTAQPRAFWEDPAFGQAISDIGALGFGYLARGPAGLFDVFSRQQGSREDRAAVEEANARQEEIYRQGLGNIRNDRDAILPELERISTEAGRQAQTTRGDLDAALSQFDSTTGDVLRDIRRLGGSERSRIRRESEALASQGSASLRSRGLGSTFLMNANQALAKERENRAMAELEDRLLTQRAGVQSSMGTTRLGAAFDAANTNRSLASELAQYATVPLTARSQFTAAENAWMAAREDPTLFGSQSTANANNVLQLQAVEAQRDAGNEAQQAQDQANTLGVANLGISGFGALFPKGFQ